jgi:hypothetical protein
MRLALSKGPNRAGVSIPSPEDGNRSTFLNVVFFNALWNTGGWTKYTDPVPSTKGFLETSVRFL